MPPLRAYHTPKTAGATGTETIAVDKPLGSSTDITYGTPATTFAADQYDVYEHSRLKADGVGLYLSFAAGSYTVQAYLAKGDNAANGVNPATTVLASVAQPLTSSTQTLTFADNMVYTLIATGTPTSVTLSLITESTASTKFGMASLRWFHAIQSQSTSSIDIYNGSGFSEANRLASGIAFGSVSAYYDITPGTIKEFPIAQTPGSSGTITPVASSTVVQVDVRAGMRGTVICAITDTTASQVFCRTIPSRVVAYVRLINDNAGQDSLVQGQFGPQKLSLTYLHLFAQYEFPRPEEVVEGSQIGSAATFTGHPATTEGAYPVVVNVAPNTVSGYGEVFVPLFIMDFAVRFVITADYANERTATAGTAGFAAGSNADFTKQTWFQFSPVFKRVHFIINTDGFATLTGIPVASNPSGDPYPFVGSLQEGIPDSTNVDVTKRFSLVATGNQNLLKQITLDNYVEPGQYYSIFVTANDPSAGSYTVYNWQRSSIITALWRLDGNVQRTSTGITAGKGLLTLVPFANNQQFNPTAAPNVVSGAFTLQLAGSNTVPTTTDLTTVGLNTAQAFVATPAAALATDNNIQLSPGSYSWTYTLINTNNVATATCLNNIPGPGTLTINSGDQLDVFVLNTFGCLKKSNDATQLKVLFVTRQSAVATNNSPMGSSATPAPAATRSTRSYLSSVPFYSAASHSASMSVFALLAALIALVFLAL
jgi:hypothetical protein